MRKLFSIIIVISIVLLSFAAIVELNNLTRAEFDNINSQTCSDVRITKESAQLQVLSGIQQDKNHLACYCFNQLLEDPGKMMQIVFDTENNKGQKVKEYSCYNWFMHFTMENL